MPSYLISSGLPSYPPGLSDKDANLVVPLYRAANSLVQLISAATGNVVYDPSEQASVAQLTKLIDAKTQKIFVKAGEALIFGSVLSLVIESGKIVAYKADASILTKPALAVCDELAGIAIGSFGEAIFLQGRTLGITGTSFGTSYYLATTGQVQSTPPVATGVLNQVIGIGLGSEGFYVNIEPIAKRPVLVYNYSPTVLRVLYADGTYTDNAV